MLDKIDNARPVLLPKSQIESELAQLDHGIPWAHHFDLDGVGTISQERSRQFYGKSQSTKNILDKTLACCRTLCSQDIAKLRILDVASAEGAYSIEFAARGAKEVVGIEGRRLYVDRANFIARAYGLTDVKFMEGDVRNLDSLVRDDRFDFVICAGILHHLAAKDWLKFLKDVGRLTADTLFLYTHVTTPEGIERFRLTGPEYAGEGLVGYLMREHEDDSSEESRKQRVRASLDNTFSFWATEETLIRGLTIAGFKTIAKIFEPHPFGGYENRNIRVVFIAKK